MKGNDETLNEMVQHADDRVFSSYITYKKKKKKRGEMRKGRGMEGGVV